MHQPKLAMNAIMTLILEIMIFQTRVMLKYPPLLQNQVAVGTKTTISSVKVTVSNNNSKIIV